MASRSVCEFSITTQKRKTDSEGIPEVKRRRVTNSVHDTEDSIDGNSSYGCVTSDTMDPRTTGLEELNIVDTEDQSDSSTIHSQDDSEQLIAKEEVSSSDSSSEGDASSSSSSSENSSGSDEGESNRKEDQVLAEMDDNEENFDYVREWVFAEHSNWTSKSDSTNSDVTAPCPSNSDCSHDELEDAAEVGSSSSESNDSSNTNNSSVFETAADTLSLEKKIAHMRRYYPVRWHKYSWGTRRTPIWHFRIRPRNNENVGRACGQKIAYQLTDSEIEEDLAVIRQANGK